MRSKEEILVAAEKRIAHLEYFEKWGQLKESQRADLELLKELVSLVAPQHGCDHDCKNCWKLKLLTSQTECDHDCKSCWKLKMMIPQWIPCSERLPVAEEEVLILAKRKWRGGSRYIITTAMYEDGTVLENNSEWIWDEIYGEWNEEEECYIVPEGWWENRHYNPDECYNNAVYDEVLAWMPLPEPWKGE